MAEIPGLIGHWKLNGDATDSSTTANDGTETDITYETGKFNQAAKFNGSSSVVDISTQSVYDELTEMSVGLWCQNDTWTQDALFEMYFGGDDRFYIATNTSDRFLLYSDIDNEDNAQSTGSLSSLVGTWIHVMLTFTSAGVAKLYINNNLELETTFTGTLADLDDGFGIKIGSRTGTWFFPGKIQDVRLYNRVITAKERRSIFQGGIGTDSNNTIIPFIEASTGLTRVSSSTLTLQDSTAIDVLKVNALPTVEAEVNEEVLYYNEAQEYIFGGYIKNIANESEKVIEVHDYGVELTDKLVNEVYRNMSPEAIAQDIIENQTSLTWNSNVTTNTIIEKIVFKDDRMIDVINQLIGLFGGNWRTDKNKNFYLEIMSETNSTASLTEGVQTNISGWKLNTDKQANKVIVKGAAYRANTTQTITATDTVFTLAREPNDLRVTVGGVELTQTVDGQIDGDFTVDVQAKTVTFNSSQTNPTFEYTYESQIKVTAGNGDIQKEIVKTYIETMQEARNLARNYLSTYQDGILTATFQTNTLDLTAFQPNYNIFVTDNVRVPAITDNFTISKVVRKYPGTIEVTVGEQEVNIFDWQKETQERVKQLEKKDDNTDFIQIYEYITDAMTVSMSLSIPRAQYRQIGANAGYYNTGRNYNDGIVYNGGDDLGDWQDF